MAPLFEVKSENTRYTPTHIESRYVYETTRVESDGTKIVVVPEKTEYQFRVERQVPKLGIMLVGWGGEWMVRIGSISYLLMRCRHPPPGHQQV